MARKAGLSYRGWTVTSYRGNAHATQVTPEGTRRFSLQVPDTDPAAFEKLVAFVADFERAEVRQKLTVETLFMKYVQAKEAEGRDMRGTRARWRILSSHFAALRPDAVDSTNTYEYARQRFSKGRGQRGGGLSQSTVWKELADLRTALRWAANENLITSVPPVWLPKESAPRSTTIGIDQVQAILDAFSAPHHRLYVLLLAGTGVRSIALRNLQWDQVDLAKGTIDFRIRATEHDPMSKRRRKPQPVVKMGTTLLTAMRAAHEQRHENCNHVLSWRGKPTGRSLVNKMTLVCKQLGLEGVSAHTFRHSAVTAMLDANITDTAAAKQVGHTDVRTTRGVYDHTKGSQETADVLDQKLVPRSRLRLVG